MQFPICSSCQNNCQHHRICFSYLLKICIKGSKTRVTVYASWSFLLVFTIYLKESVKVDVEPGCAPLLDMAGAHLAFFSPAPSKGAQISVEVSITPHTAHRTSKPDPPAVTNSSCLSWIQRGTCDLNAWWHGPRTCVGCWVDGVLSAILWPPQ